VPHHSCTKFRPLFSIALEIVARGGTAEIGPAVLAPVAYETSVTHQLFEPLSLPKRAVERVPDTSKPRRRKIICGDGSLPSLKQTVRCTDKDIDEVQLRAQCGQGLRFADLGRRKNAVV
jgi:hypothetical protein